VLTKLDIYILINQRELKLNIRKMAHVVAGFSGFNNVFGIG